MRKLPIVFAVAMAPSWALAQGQFPAASNQSVYIPGAVGEYTNPSGEAVADSLTNPHPVVCVSGCSGGSGSNAAAGATGAAVPADASYAGFNAGGNLVGVSSASPMPVADSTAETNTGKIGNTQGPVAAGTAAANSNLTGCVYNSTLPTPSSGQQMATQCDPLGGQQVVGQRSIVVKGSINNGQTSYASNNCIGGLIAVSTGLPAGMVVASVTIRVLVPNSVNANTTTMGIIAFDADPTSSSFTDNTAVSIAAADVSKIAFQNAALGSTPASAVGEGVSAYSITTGRLAVDGSGNIYLAIWASNAVFNAISATNSLKFRAEIQL